MAAEPKSPKLNEASRILDLVKKSRPGHGAGSAGTPLNPPGKPSPKG